MDEFFDDDDKEVNEDFDEILYESVEDFKDLIATYVLNRDTSSIIKAITKKLNDQTTEEAVAYMSHFIQHLVEYIYLQTFHHFIDKELNSNIEKLFYRKIYGRLDPFIHDVIYNRLIGSLVKSGLPIEKIPTLDQLRSNTFFYPPKFNFVLEQIRQYFMEEQRLLTDREVLRHLPADITNIVSEELFGGKSDREKRRELVHKAMVHRPNFDPNVPDLIGKYMGFGGRKSPVRRGSPGRRKSPVRRGSPGRRKSPVRRGSPRSRRRSP
jgi:hypothetical protein